MDQVTYRTTDPTRWGPGQNSDLSAPQIDINFFVLAQAINAVQETSGAIGIDYFVVNGDQLFVHLTNHQVIGPYTLPVASFNPRGEWEPDTLYGVMDVVSNDGSLYLVIFQHTSQATFNPNANDGSGHDFYALLLEQPPDELPPGGETGQFLVKSSGSPYATEWATQFRNLGMYFVGTIEANEILLRYIVPEDMTLPVGLAGSQAFAEIAPDSEETFDLFKNNTLIGSVSFSPSPEEVAFTFVDAVEFAPGDILSVIGPPSPDSVGANFSITLVATLP